MMRSPYPAIRIPVDYTPALPGAPRERRSALRPTGRGKSPFRGDSVTPTGVNGGMATWGSRVAPVTGRKSMKRPGWSSSIAGGSHITAPGV